LGAIRRGADISAVARALTLNVNQDIKRWKYPIGVCQSRNNFCFHGIDPHGKEDELLKFVVGSFT